MYKYTRYLIVTFSFFFIGLAAKAQIVFGSLVPDDQQYITGTVPQSIVCSGVSGGSASPHYVYQWQQLISGTWTDRAGDVGLTLAFSGPQTGLLEVRLKVVETNSNTTGYSNICYVEAVSAIVVGPISPTSQTINYGTNAATIAVSGISGGSLDYTYQWEKSPDGSSWSNSSSGSASITPTGLTATTYFRLKVGSANGYQYSAVSVVNVNPQLIPGSVFPTDITISAGTSPGLLMAGAPTGGACGGNYTYLWQSSADKTTWVSAGSSVLNFVPGNLSTTTYFRLMVSCGTDIQYSNLVSVRVLSIPDLSYLRTRAILKPGVTDTSTANGLGNASDVAQETEYYDGLGRPIENVKKQASPLLKDLVSFQVYDEFGREALKYLPYVSPSSDGKYKNPLGEQYAFNAMQFPNDQRFYSRTEFEASPMNRAVGDYAAGDSWVGSARGIKIQFKINQVLDSVQNWAIDTIAGSKPVSSSSYNAGQLLKGVIQDEQGHTVVQYKDKDGRIILKKVQLWDTPSAGHSGWLCTYYIYDDLGNLRFVISPKAVDWLQANGWSFASTVGIKVADELCYRYEYDIRLRMVVKKIPGAAEVWTVYDQWDRAALTQDGNLRKQHKWFFTKYDALNRPIVTGFFSRAMDTTQQAMTAYLNSQSLARYENYQTASYPLYSLNQSFPAVSMSDVLTFTYFDNYSWASWYGDYGSKDNSFDNKFDAPSNVVYPYPQPMTQGASVQGLVTGTWDVNGGGLIRANYYDDRARIIQTKNYNLTGGVDILTMQYAFSGKVMRTYLRHQLAGSNAQIHTAATRYVFDFAGRDKSVWKNVDNMGEQLIDSMQYNEIGQLRAKYLGNALDSLVYDYNIRGWATGINRKYLTGNATNYFGIELAYDRQGVQTGATFASLQFGGNVAGVVWKGAGDGVNRKYDYYYDNLNRLNRAAFTQNSSGSWDSSIVNYSVNNISYDANGNLLTMNQRGFKINSSTLIDALTYTYDANSNKLTRVSDAANDSLTKLGDFHYGTKQAIDYVYDDNANLTTDNNKSIDNVVYNHLNLPISIHMKGKGNIEYWYDAGGMKILKKTTDSLSRHITTTKYISGFVYQHMDTITNSSGGPDSLQFMAHEEGRLRWAFHRWTNGSTGYQWEYDFFEKDYQGNTRTILTQQKDTTVYRATMEAAYRATENALFYNIPQTCYRRSGVPGTYPYDPNATTPNDSVCFLSGSTPKEGPAIILKVMAGDRFDVAVNALYRSGTGSGTTDATTEILSSLAQGVFSLTGGAKGSLSSLNNGVSSPLLGAINAYRSQYTAPPTGKPAAFLNYMVLDEQFNYDGTSSGAIPVGGPDTLIPPLARSNLSVKKSGYLYIYLTNETKGLVVFFDNLTIVHYAGPLLEENHYYPYGLSMAGISDKALKPKYIDNKIRYNGKELQNGEFGDGSGLDLYDFGARMQDPQLGVWHNPDPLAENSRRWSPFAYVYDNPIRFIDPDGMEVSSTLNSVTYTGIDAVNAFKQFKQQYGDKNSDDNEEDLETQIRNRFLAKDYEGGVNLLFDKNPALSKYLDRKYFDWGFDLRTSGFVFLTTGPELRTNGGEERIARITVYELAMDDFANKKTSYALLVNSLFHELVHVKQKFGLDGVPMIPGGPAAEADAYLREAQNTKLPQLEGRERNTEFAWQLIKMHLFNPKVTFGNPDPYVISLKLQIRKLLNYVTPETAANAAIFIQENTKGHIDVFN